MIAYRLLCKDLSFQYVQTSSRLVYKNSKPDFIVSTHRPLTEEEGKDLMSKRTMDFKVSYLDAGLSTQYFETGESATTGTNGPKLNPRYVFCVEHMQIYYSLNIYFLFSDVIKLIMD